MENEATQSNDIQHLTARRDALRAKLARPSGPKNATEQIAEHFHLGRVGGSGRNVARLNQTRERNIESTINRAVEYVAAEKDLAWVEAQIRAVEAEPARQQAEARADQLMTQNGKAACGAIKAGGRVRWIQSGTLVTVVRVNRTSVTVEMCGSHERLPFSEVVAA